jgi:predicted O-methyltransferase YrrM|tara:strand:+ start:511 stop:1854 length:1344 start_codon:yes stop_codon:yes gene_type:complete
MSKNVIFWVGVKNQQYFEKYGGWEWMDISRKTWEYWCKKHDVIFFPMEKPIEEDLTRFRINWQKSIFCFDLLEDAGIDYDQIFLVDATCMVKWDMPNIFELTDHKFTAWREKDNLRWVYDSIEGYKNFFSYELNKYDYFSSGVIIFNKSHKDIFLEFKQLYYDNIDKFVELQDKTVRKGTEQTPLNYWLQMNNVEMNLDLPFSYKLTHIHRKDMFNHNWQLNEDMTPFFIKYGKNWVFNGIPKDQRTNVMSQIWDVVKYNYDDDYVLNVIENKGENKNTTSRKFKEDILRVFGDGYKDKTILELGCHQGNTTRVYSECFGKVIAVERSEQNIEIAKENCSDVNNVEFINMDVYDENFKIPNADVVHVDAGHTFQEVVYDIERLSKQLDNLIFIFDDYGHEGRTVRDAINEKLLDGTIKLVTHIGEDKGYVAANNKTFIGREGVICNV